MKKALLILLALMLLGAVGGGIWIFNKLCPMAPDLETLTIPTTAQNATLSENGGEPYMIPDADAAEILALLADAEPTRRMCMDDTPSVRPYLSLEFTKEAATGTQGWRICFYCDGGTVYAELPYTGAYRLDDAAWNFVDMVYKMAVQAE